MILFDDIDDYLCYLQNCPKYHCANSEIDYALLDGDNQHSTRASSIDSLVEKDMLKHMQEVVWIKSSYGTHEILNSYFKQKESHDNVCIPVHRYIHTRYLKSVPIEKSSFFFPTLSLRTLRVDNFKYIKFGLPLIFGQATRGLVKGEVMSSLLVSDILFSSCNIPNLDIIYDSVGYCSSVFESFSAMDRFAKLDTSEFIPISCAMGKLLKENSFEDILKFSEKIITDVSLMCAKLFDNGVGLEFHGQNLLINANFNEINSFRYLYRDCGNCDVNVSRLRSHSHDILQYYSDNFKFFFNQRDDDLLFHGLWKTSRLFFFGFFGFWLNKYCSDLNIYEFIERSTHPEMRKWVY